MKIITMLIIHDEAIEACVKLTNRYMTERFLTRQSH